MVFLDRAGYFYAKDLWEHVSGEREIETVGDSSASCVRVDDPLKSGTSCSKLPELNAVEGCWDQLQEWFKYRLVPDLSSLKDHISRGLNAVSEPNIWPYLSKEFDLIIIILFSRITLTTTFNIYKI